MDLFEVLLELPVINKGIFPFRNKLSFKLLRELHHLSFQKISLRNREAIGIERALIWISEFNGSLW